MRVGVSVLLRAVVVAGTRATALILDWFDMGLEMLSSLSKD